MSVMKYYQVFYDLPVLTFYRNKFVKFPDKTVIKILLKYIFKMAIFNSNDFLQRILFCLVLCLIEFITCIIIVIIFLVVNI